jgi:hypothetical protein
LEFENIITAQLQDQSALIFLIIHANNIGGASKYLRKEFQGFLFVAALLINFTNDLDFVNEDQIGNSTLSDPRWFLCNP